MRYAIVIENAGNNFSACVPDLPGCVATGAKPWKKPKTLFVKPSRSISTAFGKIGLPVPLPTSQVEYIEVAA